ncbi:hypothetical protein LWI28_014557 [Acer negundo]|uniref:Disease resistance N-terminal domain-containing protein n=1 Tax=Acer negundo TaxID=4023 RepID=A0AAD5J6C8_ACENE|nr:hypothetical protein LWI28_014557 [Acer negundo]
MVRYRTLLPPHPDISLYHSSHRRRVAIPPAAAVDFVFVENHALFVTTCSLASSTSCNVNSNINISPSSSSSTSSSQCQQHAGVVSGRLLIPTQPYIANLGSISDHTVEKWLHMAKDALYDAEDVLDDLATEALKSKLEASSQTNTTNQVNQWRKYGHSSCSSFEDCLAIFMNQAFENGNVYAFPSLEMIRTKIVNKCECLPLADMFC